MTTHSDVTGQEFNCDVTLNGAVTFGAAATIVGGMVHLVLDVPNLVGTGVFGLPSPVAGTVEKIWTRLKAPLTTGNATLTAKIGAVSVTSGVVTIEQAASAIGDIDSATPSAAKTVAQGSSLSVTVGGTNDAAVGATVVFVIKRTA